jgi:hypothetical protein
MKFQKNKEGGKQFEPDSKPNSLEDMATLGDCKKHDLLPCVNREIEIYNQSLETKGMLRHDHEQSNSLTDMRKNSSHIADPIGLAEFGQHTKNLFLSMEPAWSLAGTLSSININAYNNNDNLRKTTAKIAIGIANGLAYLNSIGYAHCNLRPENVVIEPGDQVKLVGFTYAKILDPGGEVDLAGIGLSMKKFAPMCATSIERLLAEIDRNKIYDGAKEEVEVAEQAIRSSVSPALDVYAFGVMVPALFFGRSGYEWWQRLFAPGPWNAMSLDTRVDILKDVYGDALSVLDRLNNQLDLEVRYSAGDIQILSDLMQWCMLFEPSERPTAQQVAEFLSQWASAPADSCSSLELERAATTSYPMPRNYMPKSPPRTPEEKILYEKRMESYAQGELLSKYLP